MLPMTLILELILFEGEKYANYSLTKIVEFSMFNIIGQIFFVCIIFLLNVILQ